MSTIIVLYFFLSSRCISPILFNELNHTPLQIHRNILWWKSYPFRNQHFLIFRINYWSFLDILNHNIIICNVLIHLIAWQAPLSDGILISKQSSGAQANSTGFLIQARMRGCWDVGRVEKSYPCKGMFG